jgi:hypothetical protein
VICKLNFVFSLCNGAECAIDKLSFYSKNNKSDLVLKSGENDKKSLSLPTDGLPAGLCQGYGLQAEVAGFAVQVLSAFARGWLASRSRSKFGNH